MARAMKNFGGGELAIVGSARTQSFWAKAMAVHDEVTVAWPSGAKERLTGLRAGRAYVITEGRGVTADTPLGGR